jgi:hypothetical protein
LATHAVRSFAGIACHPTSLASVSVLRFLVDGRI